MKIANALAWTAVLLLSPIPPALAADDELRAAPSDPELVSELEKAGHANLDAAFARAGAEATRAAEGSLALLSAASARLESVATGMRADAARLRAEGTPAGRLPPREGPPSKEALLLELENGADAVSLSAQMAGLKREAFRLKASSQSLRLPELTREEWVSRGEAYRSEERRRDLLRAEKYVQEALARAPKRVRRGGVPLPPGKEEALAALQDCLSELKATRAALGDSATAAEGCGSGSPSEPAKAVKQALRQADADIESLRRELDLLDSAWRLEALAEASFDER